jgi:ADP-heptose:LPS heptosyltransferase
VLSFEDEFGPLLGDLPFAFALILKALLKRADLVAGVPAGPLHVALAYQHIPVVGIWLAHHPDWYEERSENALHLLGKPLFDMRYHRRPANTSLPDHLRNRSIELREQPSVRADDVWQAAQQLLR